MEKEFNGLEALLSEQWNSFLYNLPAITMALLLLVIGLVIINQLRKLAERFIGNRSRDPLATDFLVNIVAFILTVFLIVIVMSVLGWSSFTNKILAAAGISTFIVGFALKDIGENFLAGIIMAFRRPFRMGDLVQINNIKGRVTRMSLRETTIKTLDGRDVYVPNGMILRNPLENYTIDNYFRNDFSIELHYKEDIDAAIQLIHQELSLEHDVEKFPEPTVVIETVTSGVVTISVRYWFKANEVSVPGNQLRSNLILRIYKKLLSDGFDMPSSTLDVNVEKN